MNTEAEPVCAAAEIAEEQGQTKRRWFAPPPPTLAKPVPLREPSEESGVGRALQTLGCLAVVGGFFAFTMFDALAGASMIGGGISLAAIGTMFHIHAVLRVIAHRLRR